MPSARIAFWQGQVLADDRRTLAEVRFAGLLGWIAEFPDSGGLSDRSNEDELLAGSENHARFADARSFASEVARSRGYRIVSRKAGLAAFAAANPDIMRSDDEPPAAGPRP